MIKIRRYIFFNIIKWKIVGDTDFPKKCIIIAAPHTHWIDFFIAIFARSLFKKKNVSFIGKKELFKFPLKYFLKWLGGIPVNRGSNSNSVDSIVEIFNQNNTFILGISPEGTRKKVDKWKTGFYYIAKKANVPVISVALDFENKQIVISKPFNLTEDINEDINHLRSFFKGVKGKIPEYS
jgi:1-acyl-sn-glycerol-3-phosphate acyltransferase|tara:strand:+ start:501 stop:1040 length:540 start_codon:yes stop_codon:yes gene_type:complete